MPGARAGSVWWVVDWSASSIVAGPWSRHQLCAWLPVCRLCAITPFTFLQLKDPFIVRMLR